MKQVDIEVCIIRKDTVPSIDDLIAELPEPRDGESLMERIRKHYHLIPQVAPDDFAEYDRAPNEFDYNRVERWLCQEKSPISSNCKAKVFKFD